MESLHYLLMKANAVVSRNILSEAGKIGLTPGQPKVLEYLWKFGEADQKTIASYCEIEQATVGSILLRMENAGLIVRRQREGNRRSLYVSLTQKGHDIAEQMLNIFTRIEDVAVSDLTEEELNQLKQLLIKVSTTVSTDLIERRQNK